MVKAIILLAGQGSRVGGAVPKQFIKVRNKPLFIYTAETFNKHNLVDEIILVAQKEYIPQVKLYVIHYKLKKVTKIIEGGLTRQESVYNAVHNIKSRPNDVILIHDAARANVSIDVITENIVECKKHDVILTATRETDTIYKKTSRGFSLIDRDFLFKAQTPQTFKFSIIKELHEKYIDESFTDDISMAIKDSLFPYIVLGNESNFKVTTKEDLEKFSSYITCKK